MKKQDKIFTVDNLTATLQEAKSCVLADYRGLKMAQLSQLRGQLKSAGGQLSIVKNSLLKRVLENLGLTLSEEDLTGPTAIIIALEEELAPLKVLAGFIKTNSLPVLKSGVWEKRVLTREEVERLSLLPAKNELIRQLPGILASPTARLVQVIANNPQKLIIILKKLEGGDN